MDKKYLAAVILIVIAIFCRIYQPIYNFAPIVAIALFSGYVFKNKNIAIGVALAASFIGDILISYINKYPLFHSTFIFIYLSYIIISLLGSKISSSNQKISTTAILGLSASFIFFIITNFGVWLVDGMYAKSISGLIDCFVAAIPFYKYSFFSDLVYVPLIFGTYYLISQQKIATSKA